MTRVNLEYVSGGCNRVVNCMHWGDAGFIAYGAQRAILLYSPEAARIVASLVGHTDNVTCVKWFTADDFNLSTPPKDIAVLASGSADGSIKIWHVDPSLNLSHSEPWKLVADLQSHTAPITSIAIHKGAEDQIILVSTAGNGAVDIWHCVARTSPVDVVQDNWTLVQQLQLPLQQCCALTTLPNDPDCMILALGGVDVAVRLFIRKSSTADFVLACSLAGHQDWIRGLAFHHAPNNRIRLASAAQDKYVRVWMIGKESEMTDAENSDINNVDLLTRFAPKPRFPCGKDNATYTASLEALLIGHEDWVHSVNWQPTAANNAVHDTDSSRPCLLSASMDRTMMIWRPDKATGLWVSEEAVGDAGANHLGYYTGSFSPDGRCIVAHGYTGALHIWMRDDTTSSWLPQHAPGGHVGCVVDCSWAAGVNSSCLLTASTDQTVRLSAHLPNGTWCEAARPQVHGHDFYSLCAIPPAFESRDTNANTTGLVRYASASEEKVIRIFQAPRVFLDTLALLGGEQIPALPPSNTNYTSIDDETAFGAVLPALGLSQKAMYADSDATALMNSNSSGIPEADSLYCAGFAGAPAGSDFAPTCAPSAVGEPPLEEHLAQNTLWPELHKLYGHGNEVFCLAAHPHGKLLASACRAQSPIDAAVWLWSTKTWSPVGQLSGHTLTVTQLAFSGNGEMLASVSRDRSIQVYTQKQHQPTNDNDDVPYELLLKINKAHSRIIWGVDWSPDSRYLLTGARDNTIKLWDFSKSSDNNNNNTGVLLLTHTFKDSVRTVAFAPCSTSSSAESTDGQQQYLIAAGLENGNVHVLRLKISTTESSDNNQVEEVWQTSEFTKHASAVRRLAWRTSSNDNNNSSSSGDSSVEYYLASCGDDHALRVFSVSA